MGRKWYYYELEEQRYRLWRERMRLEVEHLKLDIQRLTQTRESQIKEGRKHNKKLQIFFVGVFILVIIWTISYEWFNRRSIEDILCVLPIWVFMYLGFKNDKGFYTVLWAFLISIVTLFYLFWKPAYSPSLLKFWYYSLFIFLVILITWLCLFFIIEKEVRKYVTPLWWVIIICTLLLYFQTEGLFWNWSELLKWWTFLVLLGFIIQQILSTVEKIWETTKEINQFRLISNFIIFWTILLFCIAENNEQKRKREKDLPVGSWELCNTWTKRDIYSWEYRDHKNYEEYNDFHRIEQFTLWCDNLPRVKKFWECECIYKRDDFFREQEKGKNKK